MNRHDHSNRNATQHQMKTDKQKTTARRSSKRSARSKTNKEDATCRGFEKNDLHQKQTQESPHNNHARHVWRQQVRQVGHCGCVRGVPDVNDEDARTRTRGQLQSTSRRNDSCDAGTLQHHQPAQSGEAAEMRRVNADMIQHSTRGSHKTFATIALSSQLFFKRLQPTF